MCAYVCITGLCFLFLVCLGNTWLLKAEAASTRGLSTETETPTFSFKSQLHQDFRARDTRNEVVTKC